MSILAFLLLLQEQPADPVVQQPLPQRMKYEPYKGLSLGFRVTSLGGELDEDGDWDEYFEGTGYGFDMEYEHLWRTSPKFAVGIYGGISWDRFQGDTLSITDSLGTFTIEHDDLDIMRFTVGCRIRETLGSFFMDQNIGFGVVSYSAVDAVFDDGAPFEFESIDASVAFAFELGGRFGFMLSKYASVFTTLSLEINGPPDESDIVEEAGFSYSRQSNFVWLIGATFDF